MSEEGCPIEETVSSVSVDPDDALAACNKHIGANGTSDVERWLKSKPVMEAIFKP